MVVIVIFSDNTEYKFNSIEDITNSENVISINCSYNKLVYLPENMDFPQLRYFDCGHNQLSFLPKNMNLPLLTEFCCSFNKLIYLPENMNFSQLQKFYCRGNNMLSLPENMNLPLLRVFNCSNNKLKYLPENIDKLFPVLQIIRCSYNQLVALPENMNFPLLHKFMCYNNQLESLPKNMNFPSLQVFDCSNNQLVSLPENMNFPQLQDFCCINNQLVSLPENMNFPALETFNLNCNNLIYLPENMNFQLIRDFCCNSNKLVSLPENMNFPLLQNFICSNNNLTSLPENMNFPQLKEFYCYDNQLVSLPVCIMNWRNLKYIIYSNNGIELSPQLERFINRIRQGSVTKLNVYGDTQNVHNSAIQGSVRDSINRLTTRRDLPKFESELLNTMILTDDVLLPTVKQLLIEYCQDDSVHSLLLLTFSEVLWYVLNTITHDFLSDSSTQTEIKRVLNQEIQDAECKCFTGRMNRVVNCLNGFSPLVEVKISDGEQIGNVIVMLKEKSLDAVGNYSVEKHKQLVTKELHERGYDSETVSQWLEYIE